MSDLIFTSRFTIRSSEIDSQKYIHPHCLLQLMQEASLQHTILHKLSIWDMEQANATWVLLQISVHYMSLPTLHEEIVVATYPTEVNGFFTFREYVVKNSEGKICATATSKWALIDIEKRKPLRIPQSIKSLIPQQVQPITAKLNRLHKSELETIQEIIKIHYFHLDWNGHVNNIQLFEFFLYSFSAEFLETHFLSTIDIHFKGEVLLQDEAMVTLSAYKPLSFYHSIINVGNQKTVTEANSTWIPK